MKTSWFNTLVDMLPKNSLTSNKPTHYAPDLKSVQYNKLYYPQGHLFKLYSIDNVSLYDWMVINWNTKEFWNQSFYNPILYDYFKLLPDCKKEIIKAYFKSITNENKWLFIEFDTSVSNKDWYNAWYLWVLDKDGNYRNVFIELSILWMIEHDFSEYKWYKYETISNLYTKEAKRLGIGFYSQDFNNNCEIQK